MNKTLNTTIQLRNDAAAQWEVKNPVLLAGELGVENDTGLFKIGDGTTAYSDLKYANDVEVASHYEVSPQEGETDTAALLRVVPNPKQDDMAIVKRLIAGTAYSYTGYHYDGDAWKALDNDYNAESIFFDADFTVTAPIGTITIPSSGSTTIAAEGKNLKQVLSTIFAKQANPTVTPVSASISLSGTTSVEAGTTITPSYTTSFGGGKYSYGPATGIAATSYSVVCNGETRETASGSFSPVVIGDQAGSINNLKATATIEYNEGAIPVDNLGNEVESLRIPSGSKIVSTPNAYSCYRNYFYGTLAAVPETITSDTIRKLKAGGAYNSSKTFTLTPGADGAACVIVAYPANTARGGLSEVLLTSTMGLDITANYEKQVNVEVEGVNGYDAIPYTVYMYAPAQIGGDEVHKITLK